MIYGGLSLAHKAFGMGRGFTLVEAAAEFCMRLHPARPCRFYPPSLTLVPPLLVRSKILASLFTDRGDSV